MYINNTYIYSVHVLLIVSSAIEMSYLALLCTICNSSCATLLWYIIVAHLVEDPSRKQSVVGSNSTQKILPQANVVLKFNL